MPLLQVWITFFSVLFISFSFYFFPIGDAKQEKFQNGNKVEEYAREAEPKNFKNVLETLLDVLEKKDKEEDLEDRTIAVPSIYGINLDDIKKLHYSGQLRPGSATDTHSCSHVRNVPNYLRKATEMWPEGIQSHYTRYTEAYGIPVIGSDKVSKKGLKRACYILRLLFADRYDIRNGFRALFGRVAIIGNGEQTRDLPEHKNLDPKWDSRARGLGAVLDNPTSSVGDDNLRCCCGDRYPNEDILVHELSHGAHLIGTVFAIPGFAVRLANAYRDAMDQGIWKDTYSATNIREYWAEGTTYYFNTQGWYTLTKPNGVTVVEGSGQTVLAGYDPSLLSLLQEVFPCNNRLIDRCAYKACSTTDFNKLHDKSGGLSLTGCQNVTTKTGLTLAACSQLTCKRDGNAFNFLNKECQVKKCSTISVNTAQGGFHVYQLKSSVSFVMTLSEESNEVLTNNCVKRDQTVSESCASPNKDASCGDLDKVMCKLRGCCYSGGSCYYSHRDCYDSLLECNLAADTCDSNNYFMLTTCPFTCGVCQYVHHINKDETKRFCHDKDLDCKNWAESGECGKNPAFMNDACPLSCNICDKLARCDAVPSGKRITCDADAAEMCFMKGCCWDNGNCFQPSDCVDILPECHVLSSRGECDRNPNYMKIKCPLSCGSCQISASLIIYYVSGCQDSNINCFEWSQKGECTLNPDYMLEQCKLSCDVCQL